MATEQEFKDHAWLWAVAAQKVARAMKDCYARGVSEVDFIDLVFRTHDILSKEEQNALLIDALGEVQDCHVVPSDDEPVH
jgi:hypothetical protein